MGCYEISGISGSSGYSFAYTLNGGDMVIPGNASETGTDLISIMNQDAPSTFTGCTDETSQTTIKLLLLTWKLLLMQKPMCLMIILRLI